MLPRIPEEGGSPARVSGGGDDLEVLAYIVALGEGLGDVASFRDRRRVVLVDVKRRVECLGDPVADGRGFVVVVEVLARVCSGICSSSRMVKPSSCPIFGFPQRKTRCNSLENFGSVCRKREKSSLRQNSSSSLG